MKSKKEVSAGGIVFKQENGNVLWLITQHSQHKGWGFPKGLIGDENQNEEIEAAALREVEEEGGVKTEIIHSTPIEIHYEYRFEDTFVDKTVFFFLMRYVSGDPKDHDWEVMDAKFVPEERVRQTLSFPTEQQAFEEALVRFEKTFDK